MSMEFDRARITDLGHGGLERTLTAKAWTRPALVRLEADQLEWSSERGGVVQPRRGLLDAFLQLETAEAERIAAFAARWGVLELCVHDFPLCHPFDHWPSLPPNGGAGIDRCEVRSIAYGYQNEPVAAWRAWARRARGMLELAAALYQGHRVKPAFWEVALGTDAPPDYRKQADRRPWPTAVELLNYWLRLTPVGPELRWRKQGILIDLGGGTLFGTLAVQLTLAVSRAEGLAVCTSCGRPYAPRRRPRAGERHYCPDCGRGAAVRDAGRVRSRRRSLARTLDAEGLSVAEIAKRLSARTSTVQGWIQA